jgi:tryptophan 2,3-dioxygenase
MNSNSLYYGDYLQLHKILDAQSPVSFTHKDSHAHDEMLFIVIHQAYELWFKQILHETYSAIDIFKQPTINDNTPELQLVVHRLQRCVSILKVLVQQIDIMETMTPMDFLDFRDMLRPASGFQSWQFKELEALLGLRYEDRYGQEYYISQLRTKEIDIIRHAESQQSLMSLVNIWLKRMPFFDTAKGWEEFNITSSSHIHPYWNTYRNCYRESLADAESSHLTSFDKLFLSDDDETANGRQLHPKACRAALFIMLYRGYPLLHLPFQLLNTLLEIDEQLSTWRYRHWNMVQRIIGSRIGTGGSTGGDYLQKALLSHSIFKEIAALTSFLIERKKLPALPDKVIDKLGFK